MQKVEFNLVEKTFTSEDGKEIKYYVLQRELINGNLFEQSVKKDKAELLLMSLAIENKK